LSCYTPPKIHFLQNNYKPDSLRLSETRYMSGNHDEHKIPKIREKFSSHGCEFTVLAINHCDFAMGSHERANKIQHLHTCFFISRFYIPYSLYS